jgi:hypothetical protein
MGTLPANASYDGTYYWGQGGSIAFTPTALDTGESGVAGFNLTGTSTVTVAAGGTMTLNAGTNNSVYAVDNVGRVSSAITVNVRQDSSYPTIGGTLTVDSSGATTVTVNGISTTDIDSNIDTLAFVSTSGVYNGSSVSGLNKRGTAGSDSYDITAFDKVGNKTKRTITITFDGTTTYSADFSGLTTHSISAPRGARPLPVRASEPLTAFTAQNATSTLSYNPNEAAARGFAPALASSTKATGTAAKAASVTENASLVRKASFTQTASQAAAKPSVSSSVEIPMANESSSEQLAATGNVADSLKPAEPATSGSVEAVKAQTSTSTRHTEKALANSLHRLVGLRLSNSLGALGDQGRNGSISTAVTGSAAARSAPMPRAPQAPQPGPAPEGRGQFALMPSGTKGRDEEDLEDGYADES